MLLRKPPPRQACRRNQPASQPTKKNTCTGGVLAAPPSVNEHVVHVLQARASMHSWSSGRVRHAQLITHARGACSSMRDGYGAACFNYLVSPLQYF